MFPIKPIYPINGMIRLLIGVKNEYAQTIDDCLNKNECVKIFSVKRISDNCIFSIGDEVLHNGVYWKIECLSIKNDVVKINDWLFIPIGKLKKVEPKKQPILITEDKVEIFECDILYYVFVNTSWNIHSNPANKHDGKNLDCKYFSTKEAAEEYANKHRPCFSIQDINDCLSDEFVFPSLRKEILQKATELAKSKNK